MVASARRGAIVLELIIDRWVRAGAGQVGGDPGG